MTDSAIRDAILPMQTATDVRRAGGKGAALARLAAAGFDVPPFFVIAHDAFYDAALDETTRRAVDGAVASLGHGPFAVRSSAVDEDGADHSHAGQFLSVLDVAADGVIEAAERVARSGLAQSVAHYREQRGLDRDGNGPAVVVQRMVPARAAGVAFSADPVSGKRDRIVISAIAGLGDRLVGGEEDGDTYMLDATGKVLERPTTDGVLGEDDLAKLHALVRAIEDHAGRPQDIEWAFETDRLFLLQARPITTPLRPAAAADSHLTILDNSNIVESYPGLVSPLTYSFAQYAYARVYRTFMSLLGVDQAAIASKAVVFDNMLARVDGRVYYNLLNWYRLLAMLPGYRLNRGFMETMMGVGEPLPREIADELAREVPTGGRLRDALRVARMAARLTAAGIRLDGTVARFYQRLGRAVATDRDRLRDMPLSALAAEYRRIESQLLDRWDAPLVNDFLCMIAFGASRKLLERWAGADGIALHNETMIGQGDIVSAEPPRRIAAMGRLAAGNETALAALDRGDRAALAAHAELSREIEAYIARFGDRCAEELKLESITLDADPAPLLKSIAAAARAPHGSTSAAGRKDPLRVLATLFEGRPVKRMIAGRFLNWAKARVRDRENLRFERTRIFGHARQVFLAMGRQLHALGAIESERDVFYLTVAELLGAIEGNAVTGDLASLVRVRKVEEGVHRALPDPAERIEIRGAAVARERVAGPVFAPDETGERTGTGCSAGRVEAPARVVTDPRGQELQRGDVLVARHTDPGWIALFANASAIVVERGSLLSHSAIVAREMGIPCVVGLKDATRWIADGDVIAVDGGTGQVRINRHAE